ncbi:hypothetical protein CPB83DRAFT_853246 [Crepidotus variabilis]|uniref:Uncharacterized protein n=1 Tax=Crepidotus variabilis TaxID=179855 RepID=A0A9P6JQ19_9AGAR|nr:hypothetical protein CPB83DRAFT_853246 [Crepidotus variabilis]
MSTAYHLRPVSDIPRSPSTTLSTISPGDHSPQYKAPGRPSSPQNGRPRRPLSPSSLRDVDLSQAPDALHRNPKFPAPPTGHDLMAMFPPAPPDNIPEMRPGPTSGFFQRQERAFFAQAGKEIVRVRVDVDLTPSSEDPLKPRPSSSARSWTSGSGSVGTVALHSPVQSSPAATPYPHPSSRPRVNQGPAPVYPMGPHPPASHPPPGHPAPSSHPASTGIRTPPQEMMPPAVSKPEYATEDDESWRRPMPYAERRRAGKHTKRVLRT